MSTDDPTTKIRYPGSAAEPGCRLTLHTAALDSGRDELGRDFVFDMPASSTFRRAIGGMVESPVTLAMTLAAGKQRATKIERFVPILVFDDDGTDPTMKRHHIVLVIGNEVLPVRHATKYLDMIFTLKGVPIALYEIESAELDDL